MKTISFKVAVIAIVLGVTGAFAVKAHTVKPRGTVDWYAYSADGINYTWVSTPPANTSCQPLTKPACEISTTVAGTPPANGFPSSYTVVAGPNRAYQPN